MTRSDEALNRLREAHAGRTWYLCHIPGNPVMYECVIMEHSVLVMGRGVTVPEAIDAAMKAANKPGAFDLSRRVPDTDTPPGP